MSKAQIIFGLAVGILTILGLFNIVEYPTYIQAPFSSLFVAILLFTAGIHAKQMYEKGHTDGFLRWIYAPLVVVVILIDVVFNAVWGTLIFREPPHEWLFTTRVKYHIKHPVTRKYESARIWADRLNWIDPGHV